MSTNKHTNDMTMDNPNPATDTSDRRPRTSFRPEVAVLAGMLARVANLADDVNSNAFSDRDRVYLRRMLPPHIFTWLIYNLADLRSARHRQECRTLGYPVELTIKLTDEVSLDTLNALQALHDQGELDDAEEAEES